MCIVLCTDVYNPLDVDLGRGSATGSCKSNKWALPSLEVMPQEFFGCNLASHVVGP